MSSLSEQLFLCIKASLHSHSRNVYVHISTLLLTHMHTCTHKHTDIDIELIHFWLYCTIYHCKWQYINIPKLCIIVSLIPHTSNFSTVYITFPVSQLTTSNLHNSIIRVKMDVCGSLIFSSFGHKL